MSWHTEILAFSALTRGGIFFSYFVMNCVAVSCGYDTCFSVKACDGLCRLLKSTGLSWNTIRVSIDGVNLCQTHYKQVPDFSRAPGSGQTTWASSSPQVPAFGSIWVLLWLLFFRSAPFMFPSWAGYLSWSLFPGVPSPKIIIILRNRPDPS